MILQYYESIPQDIHWSWASISTCKSQSYNKSTPQDTYWTGAGHGVYQSGTSLDYTTTSHCTYPSVPSEPLQSHARCKMQNSSTTARHHNRRLHQRASIESILQHSEYSTAHTIIILVGCSSPPLSISSPVAPSHNQQTSSLSLDFSTSRTFSRPTDADHPPLLRRGIPLLIWPCKGQRFEGYCLL